jgi:mono/diheme cytochrome c family protein
MKVKLLAAVLMSAIVGPANAADTQVERGNDLVHIMGCTDCHTPGNFLGHIDNTRFLGGSDVGFGSPAGVFFAPNLTPDKATGLGNWTEEQIVTAFTKGQRPDGRMLSPIMPYPNEGASVTKTDAMAIAAYLKSLPPVSNKVPGPFGPDQEPTGLIMAIQPAAAYFAGHKPPK